MKFPKSFLCLFFCSLFLLPVTAEENPLSFEIGVDFGFAPASEKVATGTVSESVSRFAPVTVFYGGVEGCINLSGSYTIPTPLGNHWLLNDANIVLTEKLEITPISFAPITSISFTPVPFLVFEAGYEIGTGWNLGGLKGIAIHSPEGLDFNRYTSLTAFENLFSKYWLQGTFQFDTGAIFDGDWKHVQTMYTYQFYYEGLTGVKDHELWCWQGTENKVNSIKEYQQVILAYQMPLVWSRVGLLFESDRYLSEDAYSNNLYNGTFREMNLSLLSQFTFTEKDVLTVLINFANRRTYENIYMAPESYNTCTGSEWYFRRIALSYTHKF